MGELLYGIHPVAEAFAAGRRTFDRLFVSRSRRAKDRETLVERAESAGVPIEFQGPEFFQSHLGTAVHQGVAAQVSGFPLSNEHTILKRAGQDKRLPLILAFDGIEDPQNLGSLVRSGLALGAHGIVIPKVRTAPLSPAVSKASAGAMEHTLFARVPNLVASLNRFKAAGLWVVGADPGSRSPVDQVDLNMGLVLVLGGEGTGIRLLVRKTCDFLLSVPQSNRVDSLNVAIAGAIMMYEIARQRRGEGTREKGRK
jgi:23S rRNA (guanosine2251-2'-O)-methyltransferase